MLHDGLLLMLLVALALSMLKLRSLIAVAILSGVYSLVLAVLYVLLDAVDVAFTEAAVGAGITLTLLLAAISLSTRDEKKTKRPPRRPFALATVMATGALLVYALAAAPPLGDPDAPVQTHVAPRYLAETPEQIGIPNVVTAILASYRGYDTLGEVTVIFTAGVAVIALLWRWRSDES